MILVTIEEEWAPLSNTITMHVKDTLPKFLFFGKKTIKKYKRFESIWYILPKCNKLSIFKSFKINRIYRKLIDEKEEKRIRLWLSMD